MWESCGITVRQVWNDGHWHCWATWRDDPESEPVVLTKDGIVDLGGDSDPDTLLLRAVQALQAAAFAERT